MAITLTKPWRGYPAGEELGHLDRTVEDRLVGTGKATRPEPPTPPPVPAKRSPKTKAKASPKSPPAESSADNEPDPDRADRSADS